MHSSSDLQVAAPAARAERRSPVVRSRWHRLPVLPRRLLLLLLLLALWQLYISLKGVSPLIFASPAAVARALWAGLGDGRLVQTTLQTLKTLLLGMGFGILAATLLTTLATWTAIGDDLLILLTAIINPLPSIAILPLALLWFGLNERALVFVIANAVTWPMAINISTGFRTVNPTLLAVGRNIGLNGWRLVKDVLIPAALPYIIAGLKTGWAFGWRTVIAAELVFGVAGGRGGLGWFINDSKYFLRIPDVFAGLVVIAIIGIAFDAVFGLVERRTVVRWGMKA